MQESVTADPFGPDDINHREVVVQWEMDQNLVSLGLKNPEGFSLVDTLYSGSVRAIGRQFYDGMRQIEYFDAMTTPDFRSKDEEDEYFQLLGRHILDTVVMSETGISGPYNSYWANLNRAGVNRLIRLLRKARDSAFGRDE